MSSDALDSEVITAIRAEVPEFEDSFQATLRHENHENHELGSFQAMSEFATWLQPRIGAPEWESAVLRSFALVEHIAATRRFPMGSALVAEFVEVTAQDACARSRMGPNTRSYIQGV